MIRHDVIVFFEEVDDGLVRMFGESSAEGECFLSTTTLLRFCHGDCSIIY